MSTLSYKHKTKTFVKAYVIVTTYYNLGQPSSRRRARPDGSMVISSLHAVFIQSRPGRLISLEILGWTNVRMDNISSFPYWVALLERSNVRTRSPSKKVKVQQMLIWRHCILPFVEKIPTWRWFSQKRTRVEDYPSKLFVKQLPSFIYSSSVLGCLVASIDFGPLAWVAQLSLHGVIQLPGHVFATCLVAHKAPGCIRAQTNPGVWLPLFPNLGWADAIHCIWLHTFNWRGELINYHHNECYRCMLHVIIRRAKIIAKPQWQRIGWILWISLAH